VDRELAGRIDRLMAEDEPAGTTTVALDCRVGMVATSFGVVNVRHPSGRPLDIDAVCVVWTPGEYADVEDLLVQLAGAR